MPGTYNEFELGKFDMLDSKTIPQGLLYRHTIDPSKASRACTLDKSMFFTFLSTFRIYF